ncbi:MAG TPA: AraC family transcriptional regulator, partial [Myxococcales bacterium]|nr:AraC family transcriptional regulator [Myxococcales bacterium]
MKKRVVLVGFDGAEGLDLFGPAEVFSGAGRRLGTAAYEVVLASERGRPIALTSGASVATRALASIRPRPADTVLVAGGADRALDIVSSSRLVVGWLARAARTVRRIGSVCDGAFIVARAGILDGRRAATHWASCDRLARAYPRIDVDREAIFVRDGAVWTSAGVTTGIDMALAMVEQDYGQRL